MDLKKRFYGVYSNLPLNVRSEIVLVLDGEPMTWQLAKLEIDNDTPLSKKILEKLASFEFI